MTHDAANPGFIDSYTITEEELEQLRKSRGRVRSRIQERPPHRDFSWEDPIESPDYSPDEFYVGASDDSGSVNMQCRFPAAIHEQMMALIQQRRIPGFRTMQDLIRDAVQHRLYYLSQRYETPPSLVRVLAAERGLSAIRKSQQLREAQEAFVEGARNELTELARTGEKDGMRRLLDDAWASLSSLSEPYQSQLRSTLEIYGPAPAHLQHHLHDHDEAFGEDDDTPPPPPSWERDQ